MLSLLAAAGLLAAFGVPRVPVARSEGGLVDDSQDRLGGDPCRPDSSAGDRRPDFCLDDRQPGSRALVVYASRILGLEDWQTGFPLAAIGIGIGIGSVAAGRLSASKVEYGLLPLGALGLTLSTLAFGLVGPGLWGTIALMGAVGVFSGLLFVPLNALVQWRAPRDRRGAVIALGNMLVNAGMLGGSVLAFALAGAGFSARGTFLGASAMLAVGTLWALWLVPDAFLRFLLIMLANTLYRLRVLGRENVPLEGPALLTPNHVSFADGLFVIASIDRPVRFVVYAEFFRSPILGPFLRAMRAIPIASTRRAADDPRSVSRGGPRA